MTAVRHGRTEGARDGGRTRRIWTATATAAWLLVTIAGIGGIIGWPLAEPAFAQSLAQSPTPSPAPSLGVSPPAAGVATPAPSGQAVCIQCSGPDASYACRVTDTSASAGDAGIRLYCITEIARTRHHESCAAARATTTPCAGEVVVLAAGGASAVTPQAATEGSVADGHHGAPDGEPVAPPPGTMVSDDPQLGPPPNDSAEAANDAKPAETSGEAPSGVEKAVDSAGKALNSAGQAVSNTAKKGWSCLSSFFSDC